MEIHWPICVAVGFCVDEWEIVSVALGFSVDELEMKGDRSAAGFCVDDLSVGFCADELEMKGDLCVAAGLVEPSLDPRRTGVSDYILLCAPILWREGKACHHMLPRLGSCESRFGNPSHRTSQSRVDRPILPRHSSQGNQSPYMEVSAPFGNDLVSRRRRRSDVVRQANLGRMQRCKYLRTSK
jgi:hypothetical protein